MKEVEAENSPMDTNTINDECFYEKDKKYLNLKTYQKMSPLNKYTCINRTASDLEIQLAKVNEWLNLNRHHFVSDDSLSNLTNVNKERSLESDKEKNGSKISLKSDLNVSHKSATDKDISSENKIEKENSWGEVKKVKKMLRNVGKTSKKKLNVSVEINTKNSASPNIDLNNSSESRHVIDVVNTPPISNLNYTEKVHVKSKNLSITNDSSPDVMFMSKDAIALEEVREKSKIATIVTSDSLSNAIFVSKDSIALEEIRIKSRIIPPVKFIYFGALAKRRKRVPFYLWAPCSTKSSFSTSEQGLQNSNTVM